MRHPPQPPSTTLNSRFVKVSITFYILGDVSFVERLEKSCVESEKMAFALHVRLRCWGGKGRGMALTVLWSSRRKVTFATSLGFCKSFEVQEKTANILLETWTRLHVQEFHT